MTLTNINVMKLYNNDKIMLIKNNKFLQILPHNNIQYGIINKYGYIITIVSA